jgi:hypothetical protein
MYEFRIIGAGVDAETFLYWEANSGKRILESSAELDSNEKAKAWNVEAELLFIMEVLQLD